MSRSSCSITENIISVQDMCRTRVMCNAINSDDAFAECDRALHTNVTSIRQCIFIALCIISSGISKYCFLCCVNSIAMAAVALKFKAGTAKEPQTADEWERLYDRLFAAYNARNKHSCTAEEEERIWHSWAHDQTMWLDAWTAWENFNTPQSQSCTGSSRASAHSGEDADAIQLLESQVSLPLADEEAETLGFKVGNAIKPKTEEEWDELYEWLGVQHRAKHTNSNTIDNDDDLWKAWCDDVQYFLMEYKDWEARVLRHREQTMQSVREPEVVEPFVWTPPFSDSSDSAEEIAVRSSSPRTKRAWRLRSVESS